MIFSSLFVLVKKDLKLFFRSKASSIVTIFLPLLIVLLAGFAFNSSSLSNVNLGIYSDNSNDLVQGVLDNFEENGFSMNKYDSIYDCVESVKLGDSHICIEFVFNESMGDFEEILFYVDYSRVNLANTLVNIVDSSAEYEADEISSLMVEDLVKSINFVKSELPKSKNSLEEGVYNLNLAIKSVNQIDSASLNVNSVISDLKSIRDSLSSNQTDLKNDLEELITLFEEFEVEQSEVDLEFSNLENYQDKSSDKLGEVLIKLNEMEVLLDSKEVEDVGKIVSPFFTEVVPINPDSKNRDYLIPDLLALIGMFGAILLGSTFVLKNKKTRAFFRNFVTPTRGVLFVLSTYLASLFILLVQFIFVFVGIKYILGMSSLTLSLGFILTSILSWSAFIFIGMFIGYVFRSEETIIFASMIVGAIFMFFSNTLLPLENISSSFQKYAMFNPLVVSHIAFKKIILFRLDFASLGYEFLILAGISLFFFVLSGVFRNLTKRVL